jgi:hypothetical protein
MSYGDLSYRMTLEQAEPPSNLQSIARQSQRIETVDALRGVAALSVAWYHFTHGNLTFLRDGRLKSSGAYGWLGLEMFFVLSGRWLIHCSVVPVRGSGGSFSGFLFSCLSLFRQGLCCSVIFRSLLWGWLRFNTGLV